VAGLSDPALLSAAALAEAAERLRPHVHRTPVLRSGWLDREVGAEVFCKCENLQRTGAFKLRGALNAVFSLGDDELARGVVAHSSGNHAQALALAARERGTRATLVMPQSAPAVKVAAVRGYGARVILCPPTQAARKETVRRLVAEEGLVEIHSSNDPRIIAGAAGAARELLEEVAELDLLLVPVGGGGLLSGSALAAHYHAPATRVIGVEPAAAATASSSLARGEIVLSNDPRTVADGLLSNLGEHTFAVVRRLGAAVATVEEEAIVTAMRGVWERMKLVIEPSAAVTVAALLDRRLDVAGRRAGIILSGGNVDLDRLPWLETRA